MSSQCSALLACALDGDIYPDDNYRYLSGAVTVNDNVEADGSIRLFSIFLYSTTKSDFYLL